MGVLHGKDLLSPKFLTAIIIDGSNRAWFVPVKYHIGDYFITIINDQKYVFSLAGSKITYQDTLVRSFQFLIYTTSNMKPISPQNMKNLEMVTIQNNLPPMNMMLFTILRILGRTEKNPFTNHKIKDLEEYVENEMKDPEKAKDNEFLDEAKNIIKYLKHLKIDEICTPIKPMTQFIEDDLITTDPKFPGSIIDAVMAAEIENKRINNIPIRSKTAWMKVVLVVLLIGIIGLVLYLAYDAGAFDAIINPIEGFGDIDFNLGGGQSVSSGDIMDRYSTPEALKAAIDRGEVNYNSLPPDVKALVDAAPTPTATP